jgi:MFS family permease
MDRGIIAGAGTLIKGCVEDPVRDCKNSRNHPLPCDPDSKHDELQCSSKCKSCGATCDEELVVQTGFGFRDEVLGMIQSCFMVGYMLGSLLFSTLAGRGYRVFRLLGCGMIVWSIGVLFCGCSGLLSHGTIGAVLLAIGRMLSGVGEAALVAVALPLLDLVLLHDPAQGRLMGFYFAAIPVGTALGFVWAGEVSDWLRWELAFLFEAPLMIPFMVWCLWFRADDTTNLMKETGRNPAGSDPNGTSSPILSLGDDTNNQQRRRNISSPLLDSSALNGENTSALLLPNSNSELSITQKYPLLRDIITCFTNPVWILTALGLAMYTYTTAGLGFYMPTFLQNYKPCDPSWHFTESEADSFFAIMVSSAGLIGVGFGGYLLDVVSKRAAAAGVDLIASTTTTATTNNSETTTTNNNHQTLLRYSFRLMVIELILASIFFAIAIFSSNVHVFFAFGWIGVTLAFATTTPTNLVLLHVVPPELKSLSMSLSLIVGHAFGDVPAPVIIGEISDKYTPFQALFTAWVGLPVSLTLWYLASIKIK